MTDALRSALSHLLAAGVAAEAAANPDRAKDYEGLAAYLLRCATDLSAIMGMAYERQLERIVAAWPPPSPQAPLPAVMFGQGQGARTYPPMDPYPPTSMADEEGADGLRPRPRRIETTGEATELAKEER